MKNAKEKILFCAQGTVISILPNGRVRMEGRRPASDWNEEKENELHREFFRLRGRSFHTSDVAVGNQVIFLIADNGDVIQIGQNDDTVTYGRIKAGSWGDISQIAASFHAVGLHSDGTVIATGYNAFGQCNVNLWRNITQIACGLFHTVGLRKDGTVIACGANDDGKCDVGSWQDIRSVIAGDDYTIGITERGTVCFCGTPNAFSEAITQWDYVDSLIPGYQSCVGLTKDGTVLSTGIDGVEKQLEAWPPMTQIGFTGGFIIGLSKDGKIYVTGKRTIDDYQDFDRKVYEEWTDILSFVTTADGFMAITKDGKIKTCLADKTFYRQLPLARWRDQRLFSSYDHLAQDYTDGAVECIAHPIGDPKPYKSTKSPSYEVWINFRSLFRLAIPGVLAYFLYSLFTDPLYWMKMHSLTWVHALLFAISLIALISLLKGTESLTRGVRAGSRCSGWTKGVIWVSALLAPIVGLLSLVGTGYSYFTYADRLGTITVQTADQLVYLDRAPRADFVLAQDIDLKEAALPSTLFFRGTFDGKGHALQNAVVGEHGWIRYHWGTVKNVTVDAPRWQTQTLFLIETNRGTIEQCTVKNVICKEEKKAFGGVVSDNRGTIKNVTVSDFSGTVASFCGIAENSTGSIRYCTVKNIKLKSNSGAICGIAGKAKDIAQCTVDAEFESAVGEVGGISGSVYENAQISRCRTAGHYTAGGAVGGIVVNADDACDILNCLCEAHLTLNPAGGSKRLSASGVVASVAKASPDDVVWVSGCGFTGSIAVGNGAYYQVGAIIADTAPEDQAAEYGENVVAAVDSCFCTATYSLKGNRSDMNRETTMCMTFSNCAFTSKYDQPVGVQLMEKPRFVNRATLLTVSFLHDTLRLDPEIWQIKDGALPQLKQQ